MAILSRHYPSDMLHNYRRHRLGAYNQTRPYDVRIATVTDHKENCVVVANMYDLFEKCA